MTRASTSDTPVTPLWPRQEQLSLTVIVPVYNERHLVEASVRRVLALEHPLLSGLQVIVVDDCSTDGSTAILQRLAAEDPRLELQRHPVNRGKGAAIRTAIPLAKNEVTVIHDADLEYDPNDLCELLVPFLREGADAVFGSRYMAGPYRRALMFKHSAMNRTITRLSNLFTDMDLTDVETCYKAIRTPLLQSIPIRSNDFRFEIEIASKLAKRRARVFEMPIKYMPRTYAEGKKIRAKDGVLAVGAILKNWAVDDIYAQDEYGGQILEAMDRSSQFNAWMTDVLRPFVGQRVLEVGAGIGTLTNLFIPRQRYVVSDINPNYLRYLRSMAAGKPYLKVAHVNASRAEDFAPYRESFDTVILVNVLEHVPDPQVALHNLFGVLEPGGRAVILVPQHPWLYGSLDEALAHRERYTEPELRRSIEAAGFEVEQMFDFNRFSVPGWWFNGKVLRKRTLSRVQLKVITTLTPLIRKFDHRLPWTGQSLIAIARKPT